MDFESFRNAVFKLNGDFNFGRESMMELGNAYLEKYPDQASRRNIPEVHIGYSLVRVCAIEKIISDTASPKREAYRKILNDFSGSHNILDGLIRAEGLESITRDYDNMNSAAHHITRVIDEIPKGMIKERFIGGMTHILNILY
ncbi:MAG: hypothetical protein MUC95_07975, partial [Spirochaetes bacterium]|nr:hypothetical protein [Spirochaetota bacterium]